MHSSDWDYAALLAALVIAAVITAVLMLVHRQENKRRAWIAAGVLMVVLALLSVLDVQARNWKDIHVATFFFGPALPVLGAMGMIRGTKGVRPWLRWPLVFLTTAVLLFGGLLIGATIAPRFFPF